MYKKYLTIYIFSLSIFALIYGCHKSTPIAPVQPSTTGTNGSVDAFTTYNNNLVVGGGFSTAGAISARCIALWDGTNWKALGEGVPYQVSCLTTYNNQLVAGLTDGSIMLWDGSSWTSIGKCKSPPVWAFTVYNRNLIAGGGFDSIGGIAAKYIAEWNGSKWLAIGNGIDNTVSSLAVYKGNLIAGNYGGIEQWTGSVWSVIDSITGLIRRLTVQNDTLIVAGSFSSISGVIVQSIALWNGSAWFALGNNYVDNPYYAANIYNGSIIATTNYGDIYKWNGTNWSNIGRTQYTNAPQASGGPGFNNIGIVWNGNLYIGGTFVACSGTAANNIACWNSSTWTGL